MSSFEKVFLLESNIVQIHLEGNKSANFAMIKGFDNSCVIKIQ